MISFSFRKSELLWPAALVLLAGLGVAWNQIEGRPLTFKPFIGLFFAFCNLLVNGYYNAKFQEITIKYRERIEAQPLLELKAQLIQELNDGQKKLSALRQQVANLEAATALSTVDKEAIRALLQPTPRAVLIERMFGFVSGVIASFVASILYELAKKSLGA